MKRFVLVVLILGVMASAGWWARSRFFTAEPTPPAITFFVIGDNHGPKAVYRELLQDAKAHGAQFVVHVGDISDYGTEEEFKQILDIEAGVGLPVHHVIGNHDIKEDPTRDLWKRIVGPVTSSFDVGPARFILLDNADRHIGFPEADLTLLKNSLASTSDTYNLIFYHRPFGLPLESVFGDDETSTSRKTVETFKKIIRAHPPAMIFSGHVHTYLPYTLENIPAFVTGGGGDPAQSLLGGSRSSFFHGLLVTLNAKGPTTEVLSLDSPLTD